MLKNIPENSTSVANLLVAALLKTHVLFCTLAFLRCSLRVFCSQKRVLRNVLAIVWLVISSNVFASEFYNQNPPEIKAVFAEQPAQGSGILRELLIAAYEAAFWSPEGTWNANQPHAISVTYFWEIEAADINNRTMDEIKNVRPEASEERMQYWRKQLDRVIPKVFNGNRITAIYRQPSGAEPARIEFFHNGKKTGTVLGSDFADAFFAIWLDATTTAPSLRKKLLGL